MAKGNEVENGTRRRAKGSKIEGKGQSQSRSKNGNSKKNNNSRSTKKSEKIEGNGEYVDEEPEVLVAPDSENDDVNEEENGSVRDDEEEEEEEEAKGAENGGAKENEKATKKINKRKKNEKKRKKSDGDEDDCSSSTCFPMNRISRIIKSEDADIRITQESVFLVNKATEKFLELFCKEAHACAVLDSKNQVWYKHLSSVVSKRKRFDFLLDIVPEKVKAEDALAEMSVAET